MHQTSRHDIYEEVAVTIAKKVLREEPDEGGAHRLAPTAVAGERLGTRQGCKAEGRASGKYRAGRGDKREDSSDAHH